MGKMLKPVQQDKPRELPVGEWFIAKSIRFLPSVEMTREEVDRGREVDYESVLIRKDN